MGTKTRLSGLAFESWLGQEIFLFP